MCQSMFCSIPAPQIWDEKAKDFMLLFLPVVGLEIGLIWTLLGIFCRLLALPVAIAALLMSAYPYLITGYIHLDGFMDVTDAVKSWRDLARRREILKDSHVGSFSVISLALLLLAQFAVFAGAPADAEIGILTLIPAVSRCGSALAVTGLNPMQSSQYVKRTKSKKHLVVLFAMLALLLTVGFIGFGRYGFVLLGCIAGYGLALWRAYRSLEGMNGDIAGYALTIGELCAVAVYALL